MVYEAVFFVT